MTGQSDFDRTIADWLETESFSSIPGEGLAQTLELTRDSRPRPALLADIGARWVGTPRDSESGAVSRWLPGIYVRPSTALMVFLLIIALISGAIFVGSRLITPTPSPAGHIGQLAYDLDGDIYVADWDGSNAVRIADGPPGSLSGCGLEGFWGAGRMWSPDGRYLAYRGRLDAAICPAAGGDMVYLTDLRGNVVGSFPSTSYGTAAVVSWSPDSTRVAAWITYDETIGVYGLDGARQARVTLPVGLGTLRDEDPQWSPDGESILMSLRQNGSDFATRRTWVLPLDGGTAEPIAEDVPCSHLDTTFSPDGEWLACTVHPDQSYQLFDDQFTGGSLIVAARDGSNQRVLMVGAGPDGIVAASPAWSPTGDRIAFTRGAFLGPAPTAHELVIVDIASGEMTSLAEAADTEAIGILKFSPEGDRILFGRTDYESTQSLWSVGTDGSDARLLVSGTDDGDWQGAAGR